MIIPMYRKLGTDFTEEIRAEIDEDRRKGTAFDYNVQQWVQSDHVHVDIEPDGPKVKSCGATIDSCEPYLAEALRHYGLLPDAEDLVLSGLG